MHLTNNERMIAAFRVDASLQIGSGHVMRCLTLADALKAQGAECHFISRDHPGNLLETIRQRGFTLSVLPSGVDVISLNTSCENHLPAHSAWLGCDWRTDSRQTGDILSAIKPDWLVVDHYALDERWESELQPYYRRLLVIDDLADRPHAADLLLDQNLGREAQDYAGLAPQHCKVLTGPQYALLRPEFAELREYSLERRASNPQIKQLLITMGGVDKDNATGQVLKTLKGCLLPDDCQITVVMGSTAPWLAGVRELAEQMPWPTQVLVNISDMAQRMADSDLAIGAAGSTSWERCCLGLPTVMVVLAENQWQGAKALHAADSAHLVGEVDDITIKLTPAVYKLIQGHDLRNMSLAASNISDGRGGVRLMKVLVSVHV